MIFVTLFDETGAKPRRVGLALRKSDIGARLLKVLQNADETKRGGFTIHDLNKLDAGTLPFSKAASLYDPDEIETAIQRRLEELGEEDSELKNLRELLHTTLWTAAQGGERARGRENVMIGDWRRTLDNAKKSRSSDSAGLLMKSSRVGSAEDVGVACGWQERDVQKAHGPRVLVHGEQPGITLEIGTESAWTLKQGARVLAKGDGATPTQRACGLLAFLTKLHNH